MVLSIFILVCVASSFVVSFIEGGWHSTTGWAMAFVGWLLVLLMEYENSKYK